MLLSAVTTPVRASVQTGEPPNLAREGDPLGLMAEAGGFARPNHGLTTVVTSHGLRYPVEISENSRKTLFLITSYVWRVLITSYVWRGGLGEVLLEIRRV